MNVCSADDFAPNLYSYLLLYYRYRSCPSLYQAVNVSSINKPTNRRSHFMFLSTSSHTSFSVDTPWSHNFSPCYSYNFYHHLNMADNLKTINQKLLQPKN